MPKFGELLATDVWAAAARTLTDISAEEIFDLPEIDSTYPGKTVTSSATADTFGSWAELVADVGVGKRLLGIVIGLATAATAHVEVEIGEGESGSESAITRGNVSALVMSPAGVGGPIFIPLWRTLTDNARLSARIRDSVVTPAGHRVVPLIA